MPLPRNLYDYCSIRISSLVEKYLVVKRKISFVDKADILLTKLIIRGGCDLKKKNDQMLKTIGQLTMERNFLQDCFRKIGEDIPSIPGFDYKGI